MAAVSGVPVRMNRHPSERGASPCDLPLRGFPPAPPKPGMRRRFAAWKYRASGGPWRERGILRRLSVKLRLLSQPISRSHRRMHLKSILNRVERHKSFVYTHATFVEGDGVEPCIEVQIKSPGPMAGRSAPAAARSGPATIGSQRGGSSSCPCGTSRCSSSTPCGESIARSAA